MSYEKKYTPDDLKIMQGWSLERKIQVTQTRIMEWFMKWNNKCYVSFSGGKDSTVLADMAAKVCKMLGCKLILWFSDTGLEFPEVKQHIKEFAEWLRVKYGVEVELVIDCPKDTDGKRITFRDVVLNEGYPIITKTVSRQVHDVQNLGSSCWATRCFDGREQGQYKMEKWKFLIDAPFKISNKCCNIMKKTPAHKFDKKTGLKPIIGTMACEGRQRRNDWLKNGCNSFDSTNPASKPMSFWRENDVLNYLVRYGLPYPSVYGEIKQNEAGDYYTTGLSRTGCVFCGFGCHLEKEPNRFQQMKQTHPKLWEYCMKSVDKGGLGMKDVLDYIEVRYE